MRLTFLGTGSAIPSERVQSGLLVEDDELVFDCGVGVMHNLNRSRVRVDDVSDFLLTHAHLDHVNDLPAIIKADWLLGRESINVYGPPGVEETVGGLLDAYDYLKQKTDVDITVFEPGDSFGVAGRRIETFPTQHSVPSTAYRVDDAFVYSGDTEPVEEIAEFAEGCDVLVHECSFPDGMDMSNHTHPSELAEMVEDCSVNRVYMTHLFPHTSGKEDEMVETVAENFDGEVATAEDMMTVEVEE
ncbi:MAG: MBL fold metallo-hydrolase [Halobacteriales archaeon]|nr:MBL fold metallo-hydrolase [Halobacteriales archaeon]